MKYLFFLLLFLIITFLSFELTHRLSKNGSPSHNQVKLLCNSDIADCGSKNLLIVPKGVCKPGGKCT